MSLRLWLPLFSLLLTIGPVVFAVINVSSGSQEGFEAGFAARVRDTEAAIQERLRGIGDEVARALTRIAADGVVSEQLLEPLSKRRFYDDQRFGHAKTMALEARRLMAAGVLDTLRIVDLGRAGHVVAMGHRTGLDPRDAWLMDLLSDVPDPGLFFRYERVEDLATGGIRAIWTLQTVHVVTRKGVRVAFAGGRELDRRLADELRTLAGQGAHVVIEDAAGRRVASTFDEALPPSVKGGYAAAEKVLLNPSREGEDAEVVGRWRVYLPRTELEERNEALWSSALIASALIGGVALLLAILLSWVLARGLNTLASAAAAIASGERDGDVTVSGPTELQRLGSVFNAMVKALKGSEERLKQSERLAAWRDLARRIAHEIKNPLSPIQLSIETLVRLKARQHPEFERYFDEASETILEEVARMDRIVTEFSNFARMAAPEPRLTDIGLLSTQVARLVELGAGPVDVDVSVEGLVEAELDSDQYRQVTHNLIKNAVEAAASGVGVGDRPPRGRVSVRVRADETTAFLEVQDDGGGMNEAVLAKLFTPYFTTRDGGTGLGLAIVKRIVDEHDGAIKVSSKPGLGATFTVLWPRKWRGGHDRA